MTTNIDHDEVIRQVVTRISELQPERDAVEVERLAREELANLRDRPVQDYLIILTERATKKRLKK